MCENSYGFLYVLYRAHMQYSSTCRICSCITSVTFDVQSHFLQFICKASNVDFSLFIYTFKHIPCTSSFFAQIIGVCIINMFMYEQNRIRSYSKG